MKRTKHILFQGILLVLTVLLFNTQESKATHIMGSDISYTCSNDTFTFLLNIYKDCNGNPLNTSQSLTFQSTSGCNVNFTRTLTYDGFTEVTPNCPSISNRCNSGASSFSYGIQRYTFTTSIVLNQWPSCCTWIVSWSDCCRNNAIQTLTNPGSQAFYTEATVNRCIAASNNSPKFSDFPIFLLCHNQDQSLNMSASETEDLPRDSISYALASPMINSSTAVTYFGSYAATRPLAFLLFPNEAAPAPAGFHIDSETGTLTFRTAGLFTGVLAIEVTEWRDINGTYQEIGKIRRDIQVSVVSCGASQNTPSLPTIASQEFCAGQQTCFNIASSDPDASDSVDVFWNEGIDGATFTTTNSTALKSTGTFCWTPTNANASNQPYYFSVLAQDNSCDVKLLTTKTYAVTVKSGPTVSPSGNIVALNGSNVLLNATETSSGATSHQWYKDGVAIGGATNLTYTATSSGKYNITSTFSSCDISSDTVEITFVNSISTFPYYEGFESNDGDWSESGTNSSWEYGAPVKTNMSRAANGSNCWATKLLSSHNANEVSYLYSPYFNFSSLSSNPTLAFNLFRRMEEDNDSLWVEYTEDGNTWTKLGTNGNGTNWYNNASGDYWHDDDLSAWRVSSILVPVLTMTNKTTVRFRFVFKTNGSYNDEGIGVDDVHIHETTDIWTGGTFIGSVTANSTGSGTWQHLTTGGDRLMSINDNNQSLGTVTLECYRNTTPPVRVIEDFIGNAQYYLDRDWVITTQNAPSGNVGIRLYFTDDEYWDLKEATSLITNPYQLGVTKYSGINEDGDLTNNAQTGYSYITPSQVIGVIPYDDGYWIEFNTSSFSEFWINSGGVSQSVPLPVDWLHFSATRRDRDVVLNWSTASELNNEYFEIEYANEKDMARGQFHSLGTIPGHPNSLTVHDYQIIDPNIREAGQRFYRLKQVDKDGESTYFPEIRIVNFDEDLSGELLKMEVHPNPFENEVALTFTSHSDGQASLKLYDTRGVLLMEQGADVAAGYNEVDLQLPAGISKGLYVLHVSYGTHYSHHKIIRK